MPSMLTFTTSSALPSFGQKTLKCGRVTAANCDTSRCPDRNDIPGRQGVRSTTGNAVPQGPKDYSRSMMVALAMPPASHMVCRP